MKLSTHLLGYCSIVAAGLLSSTGAAAMAAADNEFLEMDLRQLMEITITTVSKKPQALGDAAAAIFVITQEDIRRSGVTTIPEALAMAPGLQVARISGSKWSISSRGFAGFTSNKLLVLVDGRTVYSPAYSGTFWDMQHTLLEDIDRIEVIRGPGGTLWGANAVNGVINIITKASRDTLGGLARTAVGNEEIFSAAGRYGFGISDNAQGRIYLTYDNRGSNRLHAEGGDANDDWQSGQSGFRLDGSQGEQSSWTLQGDLYKNSENQILFPFWLEQPPYLVAQYGDIDARGGNLLGRWRQELAGGNAFTIQAYYDYNDREDDYYQQTFDTIDLEMQYEAALGKRNSLTLGAGYRNITGDFTNTFIVQLPDRTDNLYSALIQDEIKLIADRLWLTLGIKYEHNDYTGSEWQPSARLLWKPRESHSLWASVARAVRTPSMVENGGRVVVASYPTPLGTGSSSFVGNEAFESEDVLAYEGGYRWQVNRSLGFDLALFYNDYSGLYTGVPVATMSGYDFTFANVVDGEGYGVEAVAEWQATDALDFALSYSYLDLDTKLTEDTGVEAFRDFIALASPRHMASLRSSYQVAEHWQINLWLRYVDSITGRSSLDLIGTGIPLDSYFVLNANVIWTPLDNLEVMLAGQNLLEESQLQYISEYVTPATEIERGVYGKITWRF